MISRAISSPSRSASVAMTRSGRLRQKRLDDLELRGGLRFDLDPPLLGNDGQLFQRPALERRVIDLGCCRFYEMADATR